MYQKLIRSGDLVELYEYEKSPSLAIYAPRKRVAKENKGNIKSHSRRIDNVGRLRKSFTRLVQANLVGIESPILATLTFVEDVRIEYGFKLFTEGMQRFRRSFGSGFKYIAVPEFGRKSTKRLHFHVLMWGLPDSYIHHEIPVYWRIRQSKKIRDRWKEWYSLKNLDESTSRGDRAFQNLWSRGYFDIVPTDGSPKIASYLSKYVFKAVHDQRLLYQKTFVSSRNVLRPLSFSSLVQIDILKEVWGIVDSPLQVTEFSTQWLGRAKLIKYNLNKK